MKKQTILEPVVFDLDNYEIKNVIAIHFNGWIRMMKYKSWNRINLN
jgi:hypothetical protein